MGYEPAKPAPSGAGKATGVSCYVRDNKNGPVFTLFLNAEFQAETMGGPIAGKRFSVGIGRDEDRGKLLLTPDPEGIEATSSLKGGASIKIAVWSAVPVDRKGGQACTFLGRAGEGYIIGLPDWTTVRRPQTVPAPAAPQRPAVPVDDSAALSRAAPEQKPSRAALIAAQAEAMKRATAK